MVSRRRAVACREWRRSSAASPPRSDLSALGRTRLDAAGPACIGSIAAGQSRFFGIGCLFPTLPTTNFPRTGLRHRGLACHYLCKFGQFFVPVFSADLRPNLLAHVSRDTVQRDQDSTRSAEMGSLKSPASPAAAHPTRTGPPAFVAPGHLSAPFWRPARRALASGKAQPVSDFPVSLRMRTPALTFVTSPLGAADGAVPQVQEGRASSLHG
jgi:hypothetical protein